MNIYVDEKELYDIIKKFNLVTGLKVTIFDNEFNVLVEYPTTHCSFCAYINSFPWGKEKCEESNIKAFKECNKTKNLLIYKCHLGLVEVVTPLIKDNVIIGYAMFGQIKLEADDNEIYDKLKKMSSSLDIDNAIALLSNVKHHSVKKIKAEAKILEMCSMYFIEGKMIDVEYKVLQNKVIDYLDNNYMADFNIDKTCAFFNISRTTLYAIVKNKKGMGLMEYIKHLRIEKTKNLLLYANLSVKEIAYLTGFSDSNHLIKTFKKATGMTPKKYKQTTS